MPRLDFGNDLAYPARGGLLSPPHGSALGRCWQERASEEA